MMATGMNLFLYGLDGIIGIIVALGMFIVNQQQAKLNEHDLALLGLPDKYARRDDVKQMEDQLMEILHRIEDKLDKKADRTQ